MTGKMKALIRRVTDGVSNKYAALIDWTRQRKRFSLKFWVGASLAPASVVVFTSHMTEVTHAFAEGAWWLASALTMMLLGMIFYEGPLLVKAFYLACVLLGLIAWRLSRYLRRLLQWLKKLESEDKKTR